MVYMVHYEILFSPSPLFKVGEQILFWNTKYLALDREQWLLMWRWNSRTNSKVIAKILYNNLTPPKFSYWIHDFQNTFFQITILFYDKTFRITFYTHKRYCSAIFIMTHLIFVQTNLPWTKRIPRLNFNTVILLKHVTT